MLLFLLLFFVFVAFLLLLIIIFVLKVGSKALFAAVAFIVHGEMTTVKSTSVEDLTKVVNLRVGATSLPIVIFLAVLPLALTTIVS